MIYIQLHTYRYYLISQQQAKAILDLLAEYIPTQTLEHILPNHPTLERALSKLSEIALQEED